MATTTNKVIGVGSPIMDVLAKVPESFLEEVGGAKGGMELVDTHTMDALLARLPGDLPKAPGGSSGNTTFAMAMLGVKSAFLGMLGDDAEGQRYRSAFQALGGDVASFKTTDSAYTARCLSMITPDHERTMRTDLGAAMLLAPTSIHADDFRGCEHAHIEGYLLFNPDLAKAVLKAAKEAGCTVSLDLGSFEVVQAAKDMLPELLQEYVDVVFANEDEAEAFCGAPKPAAGVRALSALCDTGAVKLGAEGALLWRKHEVIRVGVEPVETVLDTTGAGDYWAAGFLYGLLHGEPLEVCGKLGAILGAEVIQHVGADLEPPVWEQVRQRVEVCCKRIPASAD